MVCHLISQVLAVVNLSKVLSLLQKQTESRAVELTQSRSLNWDGIHCCGANGLRLHVTSRSKRFFENAPQRA